MNKIWALIKGTTADFCQVAKMDYSCWIFSSSNNNAYNYNSRYLFEYVRENFPEIKAYYVVNDPEKRKMLIATKGNYFLETTSWQGMRKVLRAGVWFTSAGLPIYSLRTRKSRIVVNLWHGVPLKKIALEEEKCSWLARRYFSLIFSKKYTHILTTSEELRTIMSKSFGVSEEIIKIWGQPRNDRLIIGNQTNFSIRQLIPELPKYKKIILYAPTYREGQETRLFPFRDYDSEKLNDWLEENQYLILICRHIAENGDFENYCSGRIHIIENQNFDITEALTLFDLLITDYSSIYIDYLFLKRPILFLPYDKKEYLARRGFNFNYNQVTPGPKPQSLIEFMAETGHLLKQTDYFAAERTAAHRFFNEVTEPCCDRICSEIILMTKRCAYEKNHNVRDI